MRRLRALVLGALVVVGVLVPALPAEAVSTPYLSSLSATSGRTAGGTRLTVTGGRFTKVKAVKFGTAYGRSISVVSSSRLVVTAPPHSAGVVDVRVVTAYGTTALKTADRFRYVAPPRVTAASLTTGYTNGGTSVRLSGSEFRRVTSVRFGTSSTTRFTVSSPTSLTVVAPARPAGTVDVRVVTAFGASASPSPVKFTYLPKPVSGVASAPTPTGATLTWTNSTSPYLAGTAIRRLAGTTAPTATTGVPVADVPKSVTTFTDTGLQPNTTYTYALFAHDASGPVSTPVAVTLRTPTLAWGDRRAADPGQGPLTALSCTGAALCVAVDGQGNGFVRTTDGWQAGQRITPAGNYPEDVSCVRGGTTCVAVDTGGRALTYDAGAGTWTVGPAAGVSLRGVSCAPTFCLAVDGQTRAWRYAAGAWSGPTALGLGPSGDVACAPAGTFCMVTDLTGKYRRWTGTWSATAAITTNAFALVTTLDCASSTRCFAGDAAERGVYRWDGSGWSGLTALAPTIEDISCASDSSCVAVGSDPADGLGKAARWNGTAWATSTIDPTQSGLGAVACPSTVFCVAATRTGDALTWTGGDAWPKTSVAPLRGNITALSCPSTAFCAAVDLFGNVTTLSGGTWSPARAVTPLSALRTVSCPSVSFCVAGGDDGRVSTWDGAQWSSPVLVDPVGGITSVSCVSADYCFAVTSAGRYGRFTSGTWSPFAFAGVADLRAVSCTGPDACVAVSGDGTATAFTGTWGAPVTLGPAALRSVSCRAGLCLAAAEDGSVSRLTSGGWSRTAGVLPATYGAAVQTSCVPGHCAAGAAGIAEYVEAGPAGGWTSPGVFPGGSVAALSCVPDAGCFATDGTDVYYAP